MQLEITIIIQKEELIESPFHMDHLYITAVKRHFQ